MIYRLQHSLSMSAKTRARYLGTPGSPVKPPGAQSGPKIAVPAGNGDERPDERIVSFKAILRNFGLEQQQVARPTVCSCVVQPSLSKIARRFAGHLERAW